MSEDPTRRALVAIVHAPAVDPLQWAALRGQIEQDGRVALVPLLRDLRRRHPGLEDDVERVIAHLKRPPPPAAKKAEVTSWLPVARGRLGVGHRPRIRALPALAAAGVTDVLTLLTPAEGAGEIARAVLAVGLRWHGLPLPNGQPPPRSRDLEIARILLAMSALLEEGGTLFVHCSAGIHRAGMISAALLGLCGWEEARVVDGLRQLRDVTHEGVGPDRLAWAASFAGRYVRVE